MSVGLGGEEAGGGDCFPLILIIETEQLDLYMEIFTRQGRVVNGEQGRWVGKGTSFHHNASCTFQWSPYLCILFIPKIKYISHKLSYHSRSELF